jgi:hypothetical protein
MPEQAEIMNLRQQQLVAGMDLPADRKLYFNGCVVTISTADCAIVLQFQNQPVALLSTSLVIAKSLAGQLSGLIQQYEEKTGQVVLTVDEIQARMEKE